MHSNNSLKHSEINNSSTVCSVFNEFEKLKERSKKPATVALVDFPLGSLELAGTCHSALGAFYGFITVIFFDSTVIKSLL